MAPVNTFYLLLFLGLGTVQCVLELPLHSQHAGLYHGPTLQPRQSQGFAEGALSYDDRWQRYGYHYIDLAVGTPPQRQSVWIRTWTSDTYFNSANATACKPSTEEPAGSCRGGTFNSTASTTFENVTSAPDLDLSYAGVAGSFGKDSFRIGSLVLEGVQFGVAEQLSGRQFVGELGLGYPADEAAVINDGETPYQNVPEVMVRANVTASRLFSIALDRADSPGSVIFGGIDSTRYTGPLETIDLINRTESYTNSEGQLSTAIKEFITTITQADFKSGEETTALWSSGSNSIAAWKKDNPAVPVVLEPGVSGMYVPTEYYDQYIAPRFPFLDEEGSCSCDYADTNDTLILTFGDKVKISVAVRDLLRPLMNETTEQSDRYENGTDKCTLFIVDGGSKEDETNDVYRLGMPIVESMYMVFDQDNNQVSIAQAATAVAETSNVIAIEAGPGQVAKVAASLNSSATPSDGAPTPSGTNTPAPDTTPVNTGAIAGGVVGGVGGLALIGAAAYFLVRRKRKTETRPMSEIANDFGHDFDGTYVNQPKNPRYNGDPTMG